MLATIRAKFRRNSNPTLHALRSFGLSEFEQKIPVYVETEQFILKTAESAFEVRRALKLRHEIFYKELQNKELPSGLDVDGFDAGCDHLLIIDRHTRQLVGTYRLVCSLFSKRFYSQAEFEMDNILALPGVKLELGRACIKKDFRTGPVITLLWRGITEYMKKTDAQYLFGCASVQTTKNHEAAAAYDWLLDNDFLRNDLDVRPTRKYRASFLHNAEIHDKSAGENLVPPLLHSYLKAGAKAVGLPAYDRDFACFDFLVLLKRSEFSRIFQRKFQIH